MALPSQASTEVESTATIPRRVGQLFWRTMLWMPLTFLYWFIMAPVLHAPITLILDALAFFGVPNWLMDVEQGARNFHFITSLKPSALGGKFNPGAAVEADVNAMVFTYGLPLFAALTLAAWQPHRWRAIVVAYFILIPFQALAIYASGLQQVIFDPVVAKQVDLNVWQRTAVAYAYQFSILIMPPVTAAVLWLLTHKSFVESFVGGRNLLTSGRRFTQGVASDQQGS